MWDYRWVKFGGFRGRRNPLPSLSFIILHFYFDWMVIVVAAAAYTQSAVTK